MKKLLLEVKPFQETLHAGMCGPASLKIVLDYYGLAKSEQEVAALFRLARSAWECTHSHSVRAKTNYRSNTAWSLPRVWTSEASTSITRGSLPQGPILSGLTHDSRFCTDDKSITRAAESLGFKTMIKNESDFSDIEAWLWKGVPVIVDWFTRGRVDYSASEVPDGHYSVVCGFDDENIYLQDPEIGGLRTIGRGDFMKVWFDFSGEYIKADELIVRQIIAIYR